jgi:hypothetical protein
MSAAEEFSFQVLDDTQLMIVFCDSRLLTDLQQFILLLIFAAFSVQALTRLPCKAVTVIQTTRPTGFLPATFVVCLFRILARASR